MESPQRVTVEYLAMVNERMTALEVRVDGIVPALQERLAAAEAALRAYKDAMPRPTAYYAVLEQPKEHGAPHAARLAAARRDVLAAVASAVTHGAAEHAQVRCFLARRQTVSVIVLLVSRVDSRSWHRHDPGEMFTALSRCGARVVQWHAIMTTVEEQHFAKSMADDELFIPVRAADVESVREHITYAEADEALGWCRMRRGNDMIYVDEGVTEAWAQLHDFQLFIHAKHEDDEDEDDA
jgi:hypothetical protein